MCAKPGTGFRAGIWLWPKPCVSCSLIFAFGSISSVGVTALSGSDEKLLSSQKGEVETLGEMFSRYLLMDLAFFPSPERSGFYPFPEGSGFSHLLRDLFFLSPEVFYVVSREEKLMEFSKITSVAAKGLIHGFFCLRLISTPIQEMILFSSVDFHVVPV